MRTIVISDLHGSCASLERSLEDASFSEGDRLIVVGDLLDGGTDDTVAAAQGLGAEILAGNHEVSAALGIVISPQDASTRQRATELSDRFTTGEWRLAAAVDGWLITHAGVSVALEDVLQRADRQVQAVADSLNDMFIAEFTQAARDSRVTWVDPERYRLIGGAMGPLWFRPHDVSMIPGGLKQIVGHTAPEYLGARLTQDLAAAGWLLVEPGGHRGLRPAFRYAIIEDGMARVVSRSE